LARGCRQAVGAWPKASLNVSIHVGSELWHGEAELAQYAGFPPETRASGSSYRFTSADASIVRPLDLRDERGPASTESKSYANAMHARTHGLKFLVDEWHYASGGMAASAAGGMPVRPLCRCFSRPLYVCTCTAPRPP
jgi:hypothetical protein